MLEKIAEIKTLLQSIRACIFHAGLTDKFVYMELGIDSSHWSKMLQGLSHFPPEKLIPLMNLCQDHTPLHWLALQSGFEIRPLPKALEEQIKKLSQEVDDKDKEIEYLKSLISVKKEGAI